MSGYQPPELLAARQAHGTGTTRVFVVTEVDQAHLVAYYAWCMASVATQPSALLARLGSTNAIKATALALA